MKNSITNNATNLVLFVLILVNANNIFNEHHAFNQFLSWISMGLLIIILYLNYKKKKDN